MSILKIENLTKKYNDRIILDDVSFEINEGEVIAIIGPSGSGKSTLLKCITQLEEIDSGEIDFNGKAGMVFQSLNLFPNMNVLENLMTAPILVQKRLKEEVKEKAIKLLEKMKLKNKAQSFPIELSGGQAQRIAIARALILEPQILLFDEPTSALDPELTNDVLNEIKRLSKEENKTMIIVTHELSFAKEIADKIIFMLDGKIIDFGTKEKVFNSQNNPKILQFIAKVL